MAGFGNSGGGFGFGGNQNNAPPGGFGGGFGSAPTAQPGSFGTAPFGSAPSSSLGGMAPAPPPTAFGSSPNVATSFTNASTPASGGNFGGGFASAPSTGGFGSAATAPFNSGFGGSTAAPPVSGFGGSSSSTGFGNNTSGGFGPTPVSTPTTAAGFGAAPAAPTSGFGVAPAAQSSGFGIAAPSAPSTTGFGSGNFGVAPAVSGFGAAPASSSSFGAAQTSSGFGAAAVSSGFASAPTTSGMSFGTSSNVMAATPAPSSGFGQATPQSSGWNTTSSASNPFGAASSGFNSGQSDGADGMMDTRNATQSGFGGGGGTHRDDGGNITFRPNNASRSPVPEVGMGDASDGDERKQAEGKLKAKIEEKKRILAAKLEEKRKKQLEKEVEKKRQSQASTSLNAGAPPFAPSNISRSRDKDERSLAERNALRFGDQSNRTKTRDMLPSDMKAKESIGQNRRAPSPVVDTPSDQQKATAREDLQSAKALVGTCEYFCPDEELLRRERESDIQQLEIPLPGKLHPDDWTLRNTVVKRFRRSAADYKLDVPEWVRPPDVLEMVCGYLEEWVMERDRQGPDPRFPQGQTPPPLEVYQFIWDRTRMIRKDFTLQNYVGTGGQCDARAVRCHERIARWHAMCEHQLSHIPEFVTMQSQQNIQELGQTMKTLNQFYDDGRATIEVPDDKGKETRPDRTDFTHGCSCDDVQGKPPLDFDGSELVNTSSGPRLLQRIIGKHAIDHDGRGTAEPEMRGIYMLLTMNNEGGMEVLKYAAKLFEERPDIYNSRPVQLALEIFKAKKEYNYARFFTILRAPTTPYLFCCIMFKHVELMRKVALRIMSKAFGARKKDTGEAIYDAYPLSRLVELLCFEDLDEARAACEHYNITVKQVKSSSSDQMSDIIFWKSSEFREPKHPDKGYVLPLPPRKMIRTIERKLNGATRLAVCRGEVSGEGATLGSLSNRVSSSRIPEKQFSPKEQEDAQALLKQQKLEAARVEESRRRREREHKELALKKEREEQERLRLDEEKLRAEREEKQKLLDLEDAKRREEEAKRQREEAEKLAAEKRAQEEARRREIEAEAKRQAEEARKIAAEKKRIEEEARRKQEEAQKERERQQRILQQQRMREEAERQKRLRLELEAKQKQEAEERRQAKEWEAKVIAAKKILIWKRWRNRVARKLEQTIKSSDSLQRLDPTFASNTFCLQSLFEKERENSRLEKDDTSHRVSDIRRVLEACNRNTSPPISLSKMVFDEAASAPSVDAERGALLLKVALVIPLSNDDAASKMADLLATWFDTRVGVNRVDSTQSTSPHNYQMIRTRSVVHLCRTAQDCSDCDIALIMIPPPWSTNQQRRNALSASVSILDESMPRIALAIGDFDHEGYDYMRSFLFETIGPEKGSFKLICNSFTSTEAMEMALKSACKSLATTFFNQSSVQIHRMSIPNVVSKSISIYLWSQMSPHAAEDANAVLECARAALSSLVAETEQLLQDNEEIWKSWPPKDFVTQDGVQGYFPDGSSLPADWSASLRRELFGRDLAILQTRLVGSFRDVAESLLFDAPIEIRDECSLLMSKGYYRRSLQFAMEGFAKYSDSIVWRVAYFPHGVFDIILERLSEATGQYQSQSMPSLILPTPDTALLDITTITNEDLLNEAALLMSDGKEPDSSPFLSPRTNKRRRSVESVSSPDHLALDLGGSKRTRGMNTTLISRDIDQSAALTQKMQDLVNGGTDDILIGEEFLSRILRDVPKM